AIEQLPARMDLWDECEALMRNEDPQVEQDLAARGEEVSQEALPSYRFYLRQRKAMDRGARTTWPSVRGLYYLMRQRAKNPRAFGTEMQGDPRTDEDKV